MEKALVKSSGIFYLKSKFFLIRILTYFSFLLIPIWAQKSGDLPFVLNGLAEILYILFICSQWFFLGKEIDYRLKIYFRSNSSMDRIVYRLFLGMFFFIIYFNVLYLFPDKWINNLFWTTWVVLGLFYSWPTRGKIIQESVTSNFSEFRYLDSFEKTLIILIVILFLFSIPELPQVVDQDALRLFFIPSDSVNAIYWNFLTVNYIPFIKYKELFSLAWSFHFYFVNMSFFLLCFYALLRYFVGRRLSILGVFAILSSWSWTKILVADYGTTLIGTYSLLWVWSLFWVARSSTYRTGLFFGLVNFFGVLLNQHWFLLWIPHLLLLNYFLSDKSVWFRKQLLRYCLFGGFLSLVIVLLNSDYFDFSYSMSDILFLDLSRLLSRKAIYSLAPLGLGLCFLNILKPNQKISHLFKIDIKYMKVLILAVLCLSTIEIICSAKIFSSFSLMWVLAIFSLFPLELIFQAMSRFRSSRNMVYLIYILICLLDSHFEGRVKVLLRTIKTADTTVTITGGPF
jgi:hypothetical protein